MRIPLIVSVNPKITREGPKVLLMDGNWELEHNIKDSTVIIQAPDSSFDPTQPKRFSGCMVQVLITSPGSENSISIYAVKCQ